MQGCGEWGRMHKVVSSPRSLHGFFMLDGFEECGMFIVLLYLTTVILAKMDWVSWGLFQ